MRRPLPTESEARQILAQRRTRPAPRPAPPVGRSLAPLIRELDKKFGRGAEALQPRWREIVGDRLARVTEPVKLTRARANAGGVLELRVAGAAALLVQHQSAEIIARVNLFLGDGAVEKLRISQGPVRGLVDPASPVRRRSVARPLDAAAEAELARSVDRAPEGLKAALMKLGRAVLGNAGGDQR